MKFDFKFTIIAIVVMVICLFGARALFSDGSSTSAPAQTNTPAPANQPDSAFTL